MRSLSKSHAWVGRSAFGIGLACTVAIAFNLPSRADTANIAASPEEQKSTKASIEDVLRNRHDDIEKLIDTASSAGQLPDAESFKTQLNSTAFKLDSQRLQPAKAMEIADDLDDLVGRIASATGKQMSTNTMEINTSRDKSLSIMESPAIKIDVIAVNLDRLRIMLDDRNDQLTQAMSDSKYSATQKAKFQKELNSLSAILGVAKMRLKSQPGVVPLAIEHDELGKRMMGIVKSYNFLPIIGLYRSPHPQG